MKILHIIYMLVSFFVSQCVLSSEPVVMIQTLDLKCVEYKMLITTLDRSTTTLDTQSVSRCPVYIYTDSLIVAVYGVNYSQIYSSSEWRSREGVVYEAGVGTCAPWWQLGSRYNDGATCWATSAPSSCHDSSVE